MCFGGSSNNSQQQLIQQQQIAQQQAEETQQLSDQQIAAQQSIAAQQQAFNEQQAAAQKAQYDQQQQQATDQATRQSTYDTGRSTLLSQGAKQVNDAFAQFTPDYFNKYAQDQVAQTQDQIDYQKQQAEKQLAFGVARQGITDSQAKVDQQGILDETAGRATADATSTAQSNAATLQQNVAAAKQNLLQQVASSESIGSPIAGSSDQAVQSSLDTAKSAISGVTSTAGDTASSFNAVPTVSTLGDIFAGAITSGSNLGQGVQAANVGSAIQAGLSGKSPNASSTSG